MAENSTNVAQFKRLAMTVIPNLPIIQKPSTTTNTYPYTPPPTSLPSLEQYRLVQLVHDPEIPVRLINELDQYADGLQESQLDNTQLSEARTQFAAAVRKAGTFVVGTETKVHPGFYSIVVEPIQGLCLALGLNVDYGDGPHFLNLRPDHAWTVGENVIAIFEHKSPGVAGRHFPKMVSLAREQETLDLLTKSSNAASILAKLILGAIYNKLEYCAVHCLTSFIFIQVVRDGETQRYQARISDIIPLTSPRTPIIAVILALILRSSNNDPLEDQPLGVQVSATGDVSSEGAATGSHAEASAPGPHTSANQQGGTSSSDSPTNIQMLPLNTLAASEYWEPRELSERALAELLSTIDGVSLYWDMEPFSKSIQRPLRREDSLVWNNLPPVETIPRLIPHSPGDRDVTPPPSPPMVPFVLCLTSSVGQGAVGSVYRGGFHDLSIPIIVKILSKERMDHELEIWRSLRGLAGMGVPGLFGAYSVEGKEGYQDTGVLIQQYAGKCLSSFDTLNHEQRHELYNIVTRMHEVNVEHGDLTPRNITLNDQGQVMVLDFSHSIYHECEGKTCDELEYLCKELELAE